MQKNWLKAVGLAVAGALIVAPVHADTIELNFHAPTFSLRAQQIAEITSTASIDWLDLYDQSQARLLGGSVSWFTLHHDAQASIEGGSIGFLSVRDRSVVRMSSVQNLSWLVLYGSDATVEIAATNVSYSLNRLSGTWADGTAFSFWAYNAQNYYPSNGLPANIVITEIPQDVIARAVPEPAAAWLFAIGMAYALFRARGVRS